MLYANAETAVYLPFGHTARLPPPPPPHSPRRTPTKFCKVFVSNFSGILQPVLEKLKTVRMQNFGRQTRCIMGDVQMANKLL